MCVITRATFFEKKKKSQIFSAKINFSQKSSFLPLFCVEILKEIAFCETRAPILYSNWLHRAKNKKYENERHQSFKVEVLKLVTSPDPHIHPNIIKCAFFEILCLFKFVCFPICHIWVKHVICGSELPGFCKIWRFGRYIPQNCTNFEAEFMSFNFNVKARRWKKILGGSL